MIEMCLNWELPEPIFEEVARDFVVTFRKYKISEKDLEGLNERQKRVVEYLKIHKIISRSEYVSLVGCSERTAFRDLEELRKDNLIVRKGKGKRTYYELT